MHKMQNLSNKSSANDDDDDDDKEDYDHEKSRPRTKVEIKEELKNAKKIKRLKDEENKQLAKIKKMEKKHWLHTLSNDFTSCYRNTIGYFEIEFKFFDKFPREDAGEFQQNCLGLIWGIILAYLFFFLLVFTFRRDPDVALYFCFVLLILSIFGISFSKDMRCIFCLIGPVLASSRLRWILLMYASVLAALGPGLNMMRNVANYRSSVTCVFDQVRLNFHIIKVVTLAPFRLIKYNIEKWSAAIRETWRKLTESIHRIHLGLFNSGTAASMQINYFQFLLNACNDKLALYNQCIIFFNNVYHNCRYKLKVGKDLCYVIRYVAKEACKVTEQLKEMCDNAKLQLNKMNNTVAKEAMKRADEAFEKLLRKVGQKETNLYTNEKASEEIKVKGIEITNVSESLKEKARKFTQMLAAIKDFLELLVIIWTVIAISFVFMQASFFRSAWLKKDSFENTYITPPFLILERDAIENNKPRTLPLIGPEKRKYITLDSSIWTKLEKMNATRGAAFILISSISLISTIIMDYIMYVFVIIIVPIFDQSYYSEKPVDLEIKIRGVSTLASLVKSMLSVLGPLKEIATDVDLPICKPIPSDPNLIIYTIVSIIVLVTLVTLAFEVRILRSRHRIMMAFYPERSMHRAMWLRTYIKNTRGSTKKFMLSNISNKIRKKKTKDQTSQISFIGFLITRSKFFAKVLSKIGQKRIFCLSCGSEGNPKFKEALSRKFTQCIQCHSMFCKSCYLYFKNICIICHIPLDTTEMEVDLHKLSSDEDFDEFKSNYINITDKNIDIKDVPGLVH